MTKPIRRGDLIVITFIEEKSAPYQVFGVFKSQDDEYVMLLGTHGDIEDKEVFIPKATIKMIVVSKRREFDRENW